MRQRINVEALYAEAEPDARLPDENPFSLDHLLKDDTNTLLKRFPSAEQRFRREPLS